MDTVIDVVVVGAGQGGLAVSYLLKQSNVQHLVLERGEVGESWRSQRWDSFHLNTPNWSNGLPGLDFYPERANAFSNRDQILAYFENYKSSFDLPVKENTAVRALEKRQHDLYFLQTESDTFYARSVVLATGSLSRPKIPKMAQKLNGEIFSISAGNYRKAELLPDGAVVVVGSGQSGCQITEDLLENERSVYLCTSRVGRVPRSYRGRDIVTWMKDMGLWDMLVDKLEDPSLQYDTQPQISGTNGGHTISLQSLARDGAILLGKVVNCEGWNINLDSNLMECISFADSKSQTFKAGIDEFIDRQGISVKAPEADPNEPALPDLKGSDQINRLDLKDAGISTVIWCTGFDADWSWLKTDVFDKFGTPKHHYGISDSHGLYFIGFPWLSKRKSGILYGIPEDAERIVGHIQEKVLNSAAN